MRTATELKMLGHLCEESGEVVQAAGQALRFRGLDTPRIRDADGSVKETGRDFLEKEIGDVLAVIEIMAKKGLISLDRIATHKNRKLSKLRDPGNRDNLGRKL